MGNRKIDPEPIVKSTNLVDHIKARLENSYEKMRDIPGEHLNPDPLENEWLGTFWSRVRKSSLGSVRETLLSFD